MEVSQVEFKVVDSVLELVDEAFSWVKTQVEAFFKLLCKGLTRALQGAKSFVINCCEKFKQVLAGTNHLIDVGLQKLSETKDEEEDKVLKSDEEVLLVDDQDKLKSHLIDVGLQKLSETKDEEKDKVLKSDEEVLLVDDQDKLKRPEMTLLLLDELMKLLQNMMSFVGYLAKNADPELRRKGEILKGFLGLAEGFIELLQLSLKQPVKVILPFVDGCFIYRKNVNKKVGDSRDFSEDKGKPAAAIAVLLGSIY